MKHMTRNYKKADAMLRSEHESTLDKMQAKRQNKKKPPELEVDSEYDILDKKINQRMKRKEALHAAMNKIHDPDIA
jgi:hypothetical protein